MTTVNRPLFKPSGQGNSLRMLRVLVIADPIVPVPPREYGGSERIVDLMCRLLVASGHQVRLMAGPGSRDYGAGLVIHRAPEKSKLSRIYRKLRFQWLSWRASRGMDVVINHGRLDYLELLYRTSVPAVHWFHNKLTGGEVSFVRRRRSTGDTFVGISRHHVSTMQPPENFKVIHNALEISPLPFFPAPVGEGYALFLGRLTRHKGVDVAIRAARLAGIRLVLAGNVSGEEGGAEFFETKVRPLLGERVEWVGPYDEAKRLQLLSGASVLLFPIQFDQEPFGLVMIEALACGVPVIATRRCATPEVIEHGRNGFLCDDEGEMAALMQRVGDLDRQECRRSVRMRFSEEVFSEKLQGLLEEVVEVRS